MSRRAALRPARQLLFVQGGGEGAHDQWDEKLVRSLQRELGSSYAIRYPRMPDEGSPDFIAWNATLEHELASLENGAILIGHSVGGTILINALAGSVPHPELGAIFLIAPPFVGEGGWPGGDLRPPRDLGARLPGRVPVHLFQGLADDTTPPAHAALYARAIPQAHIHRLAGRDHQLDGDLTEVAAVIRKL